MNLYAKKAEDKAELLALFGGKEPTWPPPNLTPCTERDYWHFRSIWFDFKAEGWMGHIKTDNGEHATAMLFYVGHGWHVDGGFAVVKVYSPSMAERIIYYQWSACLHEFKDKTIGNCLTRTTCAKCGKFFDTDSSD